MTLPALRRANCGHYIPSELPPVGTENTADVYLCPTCREAAFSHRPEVKVVEPEAKVINPETKRRPGRPRKNF